MARITQEQITQINEIYYQCHIYAETARRVGVSPATVKKYVDPTYKPVAERTIKKFDGDISKFDTSLFHNQADNWGVLCVLSDEERAEIEKLWEEL